MGKRPRLGRARSPGFGLITILLLMGMVITIAAAVTARVQVTLSNASQREDRARADYAANAGLHRAMIELSRDPDWETSAPLTGTLTSNTDLGYQVEVVNNRLGTTPRVVAGGPTVPPKRVWMRARGTVAGQVLASGLGQAEAFVLRPEPVFNDVLHLKATPAANGYFFLQQTKVDSFDGNVAVGSPPSYYSDYLGAGGPPRVAATIWVNRAIAMSQSARIDANLAGDAPDLDITQDGTTSWYGQEIANNDEEAPLIFHKPRAWTNTAGATPPSSGSIAPGCYDTLVSTGNVALGAGTYYFSRFEVGAGHSVSVDSSVTATTPCVVYVGGMLTMGDGAMVNMVGPGSPHPSRLLQFYCTDDIIAPFAGTYINCGDNTEMSCVIAGQSAFYHAALSTNVEFYGAIYASDAWLSVGEKIHYDTSLKDNVLAGIPEWVLVNEGGD